MAFLLFGPLFILMACLLLIVITGDTAWAIPLGIVGVLHCAVMLNMARHYTHARSFFLIGDLALLVAWPLIAWSWFIEGALIFVFIVPLLGLSLLMILVGSRVAARKHQEDLDELERQLQDIEERLQDVRLMRSCLMSTDEGSN